MMKYLDKNYLSCFSEKKKMSPRKGVGLFFFPPSLKSSRPGERTLRSHNTGKPDSYRAVQAGITQ